MIADRLGRPSGWSGRAPAPTPTRWGSTPILNMKGYRGDYGLERYQGFRVWNLGARCPTRSWWRRRREVEADAVLVSQVVTQKNVHLSNLTGLVDLLEAEGMRDRVILIAGGPRITHELAVELGYDAGFGPGTLPSQVAAFIVKTLLERQPQ